ncbi:MAG: hypothetical protein PHG03_03740 [Bacilli bacterium]|nr:hypothetical protein [Bacilli bacterium]MDD4795653.1 hypothetical protein [Bacilli bacterium]
MKKILLILALCLLITGCTNIDKSDEDKLINEIVESKLELTNTYRTGYKYYLPPNLVSREVKELNEKITSKGYKYYLYVDLVSYYNNIKKEYTLNENSYLSKIINYQDKEGYLEVNLQNDKYLIEIMYNYAKIELIVDINYLKEGIVNSLVILSTIKYNDDIIQNMMGEDILDFNEEALNIFEVRGRDSNYVEYVQEYDKYDDDIPDPDLIN